MRGLTWAGVLLISCTDSEVQQDRVTGGPATGGPVAAPASSALNADAVKGISDPGLQQLLSDHWEARLRAEPTWATQLGDHRFDAELSDLTAGAIAARKAERDGFLERARALPTAGMAERDRRTLLLFTDVLAAEAAADVCHSEEWLVSPRINAFAFANDLKDGHPVVTLDDGAHLVARLGKLAGQLDAAGDNLRRGANAGRVQDGESVRRTVAQIDEQLAAGPEKWPLWEISTAVHGDWPPSEADKFSADVQKLVSGPILDAVKRYRDLLRDVVLPAARPAEKAGVKHLPDGALCYQALIQRETTLPKTASELHATGKAELERIHRGLADTGERVFGTRDVEAIIEKLRSDPGLRFKTADEVEAKAQASLDAAKAAIPRFFGVLPKADCVVKRIPDFEAPYTTIAYYQPAHADGSKPGAYFINTYEPQTRPRFEAVALAVHEAIPGHHLQIAIAQELNDLPAFRRYEGATAFVEGWALYTEQLADEMGLYEDDLDRLGMWSFESWRASRLVVDTGIHDQGWTRDEAVNFMLDNTPLAKNNIENEVDRYISWPGQALAYKTGQLEIWRLRRKAEDELGAKFDLKAFHDVVLGGGAVTLPVLEARVADWMVATAK